MLGAQMGAIARLLLLADLLEEGATRAQLLLKLKTRLEGLLRGRFVYDARWVAPRRLVRSCGGRRRLGTAPPRQACSRPGCPPPAAAAAARRPPAGCC